VVWVSHMKTTIDIADSLLLQAKRLAARRQTTLKAVIEAALRDALAAEQGRAGDRFELRTHTFKGKGLQPGLSWDDWNAMLSMSYEGRGG